MKIYKIAEMYKKAQFGLFKNIKKRDPDPDRYTIEYAKNTNKVEDLRYIYSFKREDNVMYEAIKNPLFPIDLLIEILTSKNQPFNFVWRAMRHPNCPPEFIKEMFDDDRNKGKDNELTRSAILSRHCPDYVIMGYLNQYLLNGKDNETIRMAAINQNAPVPIIIAILAKNKNDVVSWNLSKNMSAPKDAVEQWLIGSGRKEKKIYPWQK